MKLQLASDLHLEFAERRGSARLIEPAQDADLLVLAGDVHVGTDGVEAFADWPVPVLYVAGNHEFYNRDWLRTREELKAAATGTNVTVLDNMVAELDGIRFLGCTLWTDFQQRGIEQVIAMSRVERHLNDYHCIKVGDRLLRAKDTLDDHRQSYHWLEAQLAVEWPGKTVVISHHGPHPLSIHPRYVGDPINAGFVSNLTPLLGRADLWLHGHVHDSFSYRVAGCQVIANPAGYFDSRHGLENRLFDPCLVIEI